MNEGIVFLVGAGPGDPGLITVKGLECVGSADVVVYDRLVDRRLLGHVAPGAELIDVGKVPGRGGDKQGEINALLVRLAKDGKRVTRLKGGDPFVFGRGGEEAEALRDNSVPFEVVPGVTSAAAAPAYAGIPLTHRGLASSFTVVTGSEAPGKDEPAVAWGDLARAGGTLVMLMGWAHLAAVVEALTKNGRSSDTPVALVHWGTEPNQRTIVGTLSDIMGKAADSGLSPPVVAVVGKVVALRRKLRWFDNRPLFGKRVLVTRTRAQAGSLSRLLYARGAEAIELPTIEIRPPSDYGPLDRALGQLSAYDWVVFTSVNAVETVLERLDSQNRDARAFGTTKAAAIGSATASCLRDHGIRADFVPDEYLSEAILAGLGREGFEGARVLLPRSDVAPDNLRQDLAKAGAAVEEVAAYRTVTPEESQARVSGILSGGIDVATFTSSSTVRNLVGMLDGDSRRVSGATIACIGPITAATARELGLNVDIIAEEHTIKGLVDALEAYFAQENPHHG